MEFYEYAFWPLLFRILYDKKEGIDTRRLERIFLKTYETTALGCIHPGNYDHALEWAMKFSCRYDNLGKAIAKWNGG